MINASDLAAALDLFKDVIERRSTIPILTYVKLSAADGRLEIVGTDLDTQLTITLPCTGDLQPVTAGHESLLRVAKACGDRDLGLTAAGTELKVGLGDGGFSLHSLPADEFPDISGFDDGTLADIEWELLAAAIDCVRPAISTEETRFYLNGIYFERIEDELALTATDGHRLHMARIPLPEGYGAVKGGIVRRQALKVLSKLLHNPECRKVGVEFGAQKVRFTIGNAVLVSKLIDGQFPDYKRVIPTTSKGALVVPVDRLLELADMACCVSSEKTRWLKLEPKAGAVSSKSPENGKFRSEFVAMTEGELPDHVGLNARYFADILEQRRGGSVRINVDDMAAPVLFEFPGDREPSFRAVQMPMRVD